MAIEFDCPHCGHHYRLKDELAGKAAQCKNCRNKITVPAAVTVPDDTPSPGVDVEAAALAALADAAKGEDDPSKKLIPVECNFCGHKWTEPLSRAGKNTLCPNPECKQRVKIPEPKDETYDWRQTRTKGPSLAKDNQPKLEGVQDAADAKQLSDKTVREHLIEVEYEPRPLKQKVMFVVLAVGALAGLVFGVLYLTRTRTEVKEDRLMQEAQGEFAKSTEGLPKEEMPPFTAVLHLGAAEHALRHNDKDKLKESMDHFAKAQTALRQAPLAPARNAAVAELAVAILTLGGTEAEARDQLRIRWEPELGLRTRPNEHLFTVHQELEKVLRLATTADLEFRAQLARRLTRELARRDQTNIAANLLPVALFNQGEQPEGRAIVALELYRLNPQSQHARKEAAALAGTKGASSSPSVQTLLLVLKPANAPPVPSLSKSGAIPEGTRLAYTGVLLLENKPDEALEVARRAGKAEEQLRALARFADWAENPAPGLDAALAVATANAKRKDVTLPPYAVLRLAQVAGAVGKLDQAKQFAETLADEGARAWAAGDAARLRLAAAPTEKGDDAWVELPDDPKKYRAGHAWGRMWIARQNARITGDRNDEVKRVAAWPAPFALFGKVGVALGLQDRDQ